MPHISDPSDSNNSDNLLGNLLRRERERQSINQSEMAARIGYSRPYLSAVENNKVPVVPELVAAYEQALGLALGSISRGQRSDPSEIGSPTYPRLTDDLGNWATSRQQSISSESSPSGSYDVYISGALTGLRLHEQVTLIHDVFETVARVCDRMKLTYWHPHRSATRPNSARETAETWLDEYEVVSSAGVLVAYVGIPSFIVGAQLEMARSANTPIVALCEASRLDKISRLILGNPALEATVAFEEPSNIDTPLEQLLWTIISRRHLDIVANDASDPLPWPTVSRLQQLLTPAQLAMAFRSPNFDSKPISVPRWRELAKSPRPIPLFEEKAKA